MAKKKIVKKPAPRGKSSKAPLIRISQVLDALENRMPLTCAESWDNVGLLCGDKSTALTGVVIGVDLTENLFALALQKNANLIILHHPPLFPKGRGLTRLVMGAENALPTLLLNAFKKNICVYVAHTNFDRCALDGMIQLAEDLGSEPIARVWESPEAGAPLLKKLVTTIPVNHFEKVRDALYEVGCGHIGNYDSCGFALSGLGNFRALNGASPFIGKVGELEQVEEIRLETLVVSGMEERVIATLKDHHPYEEVAYDLYAVEQEPPHKGFVWGLGYGFIAELNKPVAYEAFCKTVKNIFKVDAFMTNQHTPKLVKKIAFTPGKGASFVKNVRSQGVDVFVTGEVGYHESIGAARSGLNVIELGHRESEHYFLKTLSAWLTEWDLPKAIGHYALDERLQRIV